MIIEKYRQSIIYLKTKYIYSMLNTGSCWKNTQNLGKLSTVFWQINKGGTFWRKRMNEDETEVYTKKI